MAIYLTNLSGDRTVDSVILKSPGMKSSLVNRNGYGDVISPRVGLGKTSFDFGSSRVENSLLIQTGRQSPKKQTFYSEYLRDYNPRPATDFRSPSAKAVKREIIERTAKPFSTVSFVNSGSHTIPPEGSRAEKSAHSEICIALYVNI